MSGGTGTVAGIVVLPSEDWPDRASVIAALGELGPVLDIHLPRADAAPLSVRTCAAVLAAAPPTPMLVLAHGDGAELLPAVALAQRTAHRAIAGYVLIAPDEDPSAQDWPDAPVLVIAPAGHAAAQRARLRGWDLVTTDPDADASSIVGAIADVLRR